MKPIISSTSVSRRSFLKTALVASTAPAIICRGLAQASGPSALGPIRREIFVPSPQPGSSVNATSFYTRKTGMDLLSTHEIVKRSDTVEVAYIRYSSDNGRTWEDGEEFPTFGKRPGAKLRRSLRGAVVDPGTGRFLRFYNEAMLPTDNPLEGFWRWVVRCAISEDGGLTWYVDEEIICAGKEFNAAHPLPSVNIGHNAVMIGDQACKQIFLPDGTLLVPVIVSPVGPDGHYFNPGGGYTYSDAAVLRGRWAADGRHMEWELSQLVKIDPNLSTRGMDEPTVAELADGRLIMVIRGSNDKKPQLPGRRWVAYSKDQGRTWTQPQPWTYASGEAFFSPAAASQLITHSSGRLFWLGIILPENSTGNRPRYPFIIGEVDRRSGLLDKSSIRVVDNRAPGESVSLQLSSPSAREDRETGEIVVNQTRWSEFSKDANHDWTANAYLYHIPVV